MQIHAALQTGNVARCAIYILSKGKTRPTLPPTLPVPSELQTFSSYQHCIFKKSFTHIKSQCIKKYPQSQRNPKSLKKKKKVDNPGIRAASCGPKRPVFDLKWLFAGRPVGSQNLVLVRLARPVVVRLPLELLVLPLEEAEL